MILISNIVWSIKLIERIKKYLVCCGCDTSYNVGPHPVSNLHIYTFVVSREFMASAASQAGDADTSRAPVLTFCSQGSVIFHHGDLLLVPKWQCISSFVFYIFVTLFPLPCGAGSTVPREGFNSSVMMPFSWCVVAVTLPIVSVHVQYQTSIYTLFFCHGHSWRVRLAKQETLTPPGHLVSPLVYRGPWMSTVVLYCWCHSDSAQFFCILHTYSFDLRHLRHLFTSVVFCKVVRLQAQATQWSRGSHVEVYLDITVSLWTENILCLISLVVFGMSSQVLTINILCSIWKYSSFSLIWR